MTHFVGTQSDPTSQAPDWTIRSTLAGFALRCIRSAFCFLALWVAPNLRNARVEHIEATLVATDVPLVDLFNFFGTDVAAKR